jgi:hypothetical protein
MRITPPLSIRISLLSLFAAGLFCCSGTAVAQRHFRFTSLSASSTNVGFGSITVGTNKKVSETLTNNGRTNVTISNAQITSSGAAFSISGLTLPTTLTSGHSYTFSVTFTPQGSGNKTGTLAVTSSAPQLSIALSGTAVAPGALASTPTSVSFGSITVGTTKAVTGTLTASGSNIVISSAGTNSAEYTMTGITLPLTLSAGKTAAFTLTFKPQSAGSAPATASFINNSGNSPLNVALSGTGTSTGGAGSTPTHSVSLTWKASSSSVAGYNVYRGTKTGGPYTKLNSVTDTGTVYSDGTVKAGATYFYVATALSSSGMESASSNEVKTVVPTP